MKTDLSHLPANKRRELDRVIQILFEEFEDAHGKPDGDRKLGRILKIILYGSYPCAPTACPAPAGSRETACPS